MNIKVAIILCALESHLSEVLLGDSTLARLVKGEEGLSDLDLVLGHPVL